MQGRALRAPGACGLPPQLFVGAIDLTATLQLETELAAGACRVIVELVLDRPVAIEAGVRFALREGGRAIGAGVVTAVDA